MNRNKVHHRGFTFIELLVSISIIAILGALLGATLHTAKAKALGIECLNNHRQLQIAWLLYSEDNSGRLPVICTYGGLGPGSEGWITADSPNTNAAKLLKGFGSLGPYTQTASVYKCPSDRTFFQLGKVKIPHVRSISLNSYMHDYIGADASGITFQTIGEISTHGASRFFTFVDTHADFLGSAGDFFVPLSTNFFPAPIYGCLPSARHNNASPVAFADGHIEMRRWVDPRTFKPVTGSSDIILCIPPSKDQQWLEKHATVRVKNL